MGGRRRGRMPLLALVVALAASSCALTGEIKRGVGLGEEPVDIDDARGPLRDMLQQRARDLARGDVEGYLSSLSPAARAVEVPIAKGAASVPLASIDLVLADAVLVDEERPRLDDVQVDLLYRYEGLAEDNLFRLSMEYDLERRNGSWEVLASRPIPEDLPVWATGPVEAARAPHTLALFRPGLANVSELLNLAEQARAQLLPSLTLEADPANLVVLARDEAEYQEMSGLAAPESSLAVAQIRYRGTAGRPVRPEGRQMVVNLAPIFERPAEGVPFEGQAEVLPVEVFQHELGHLALGPFTRAQTPSWLVEGAAMFLSGERRVDAWRTISQEDLFEELEAAKLGRPGGLDVGLQYAHANATALYLVEAFGPEKFWELYRSFAEGGGSAEGDSTDPSPALRRIYQFDEQELDRRVGEWIGAAG